MKNTKVIALVLAVLLMVSGAAVGIYAADYYHMDQTAAAVMADRDTVVVDHTDNLAIFSAPDAKVGFIFYPGGKVEYTAYAPLMKTLAEYGVLCLIPKMPLNLAVLDSNAAHKLPEQFPQIETWYIGGHSLGGSMAASCAANSDLFAGVILLAAYSTADLTHSGLDVLSIYGTEDGVLNMEKYAEYFPNLPDDTVEHVITGANHAGFGNYGPQDGDGEAYFSPYEQQAMTATAILEFMKVLTPSDDLIYRMYLHDDSHGWLRSVLTLSPAGKDYFLSEPIYSSRVNAGSYTIENGILTCRYDPNTVYRFTVTDEGMVFRAEESAPLYAHESLFDGSPNAQIQVPDGALFAP